MTSLLGLIGSERPAAALGGGGRANNQVWAHAWWDGDRADFEFDLAAADMSVQLYTIRFGIIGESAQQLDEHWDLGPYLVKYPGPGPVEFLRGAQVPFVTMSVVSPGAMYWFVANGCENYGKDFFGFVRCNQWSPWSPPLYLYIPDTGTQWFDSDIATDVQPWPAGWEISNGNYRDLPLCSVQYNSTQQIGKYFDGACHFGYGGAEVVRTGAMVLYQVDANVGWAWNNSDGFMQSAVAGGWENGGPLYICRAPYMGGYHPGKVVNGKCNISYGGVEVPVGGYWQVLQH